MQIFNVFCENPYGDNIMMTIAAKDQNEAIKLFKKKAKVPSINKVSLERAKEVIKEYKAFIKRVGYVSYNFGFLNTYMILPSDFSKEGFLKLRDRVQQNYINDYYKEDKSIQWNIDNNVFDIKNITEQVKNLKVGVVLDTHYIYHGR